MFFQKKASLIYLLLLTLTTIAQAQIGIGTTTPANSAKLDITSTNKGFLPPRMTYIQRNAIAAPVAGLQVWCTNCGTSGEQQVYNGVRWTNMIGGTASESLPNPPTSPVAKIGSTKASISFSTPANNGSSVITSYTVTAAPGGASATGSSSPIIVSGLTNGVSYTFTVVANNAIGSSAPSVASNAIIPNCGAYNNSGTYLVFGCYNLGVTTTVDPLIGANQTSALYGDYYQWGRKTDGHEKQNSDTVKTQAVNNEATSPSRVIGKFIISSSDWSSVQNSSLWGDGSGGTNLNPGKATNDPCPAGFKVPSVSQWGSIFKGNTTSGAPGTAITNTWTWTGSGYAVGLGLYLPATGFRNGNNGTYGQAGLGHFWSSTNNPVVSTESILLIFNAIDVNPSYNVPRIHGATIRCVAE